MKNMDKLALIQVDRKLKSLRPALKNAKVRPGWIRYMRQALGMTLQKLAERTGVSKPSVAQAERNEAKGKVTIETLKKMAQAMDCEFVYAFIPKNSVQDIIKDNALKKAKHLILNADTHMMLEDQRVKEDIKIRTKILADVLIKKGDVW